MLFPFLHRGLLVRIKFATLARINSGLQTQRPNFERSHLTCFSLVVRVLICSLYDSSLWLAYCTHFKINKCVTRLILNCARGKKNALKLALSGFFPRFIRGSIRIYGYFFFLFQFLTIFPDLFWDNFWKRRPWILWTMVQKFCHF